MSGRWIAAMLVTLVLGGCASSFAVSPSGSSGDAPFSGIEERSHGRP